MKISKRRRRENKTDYRLRKELLKSEFPRIVFRKSNRYVTGQYIESDEARDKIVVGVNSKQLLELGWPDNKEGSLKNLTSCYLTGLLLGKKAVDKGKKIGILDIGLLRSMKGSKIYAFAKGVSDAGLKLKVSKEMFPTEERLKNKTIDITKIKEKILNG